MMEAKQKKTERYTEETLQKALEAVRMGFPIRTIARQYKIPKTTLFYKFNGKSKPSICKRGPKCILGNDDEDKLLEWIFHMSNQGFPVTKSHLIESSRMLLNAKEKKTPFVDNRPGRHWYSAFQSRHPEVTDKMSANLSQIRDSLTEEKIRLWFDRNTLYFKEKNITKIGASRVFTCDELAFFLSPEGTIVLDRNEEKSACNFMKKDEKECLTTLFCGNAAGQLLPPMVIFPYVRIPRNIVINMPKSWGIGRTDSGWMTGESFYKWISSIFYPWLINNNIEFPVVLFIDSNSSFLTLSLTKFCEERNIEIIALHPNSTHISQPFSETLFQDLKTAWTEAVGNWRVENGEKRLKREDFSRVMNNAISKLDLSIILQNGFRASGLHPYSVNAIDFKKYFGESAEITPEPVPFSRNIESNKFLEFMEREIPEDIIQSFKRNAFETEYVGLEQYKGLFEFWRLIKSKTIKEEFADE